MWREGQRNPFDANFVAICCRKKRARKKFRALVYGGGWLTTEQLSIPTQEEMVGNER